MRALPAWTPLLLLAALAAPVRAQSGAAAGGPDLPALPALAPGSPRDTLLYADRAEVSVSASDYPPGFDPAAAAPLLVDAWVPQALTGTGFAELIQYQLPLGYDPAGPPIPMLVAWHGFGASAASVSAQTALDEWCHALGWAYLSVTGIDDALFGTPPSQQNAAAAIQWMLDGFAIDPDRIHMVGFSMGAGIVGNFAARHREPDGIMIAGLGLVSGSFDWISVWKNDPSVKSWMHNSWNFGGPPAKDEFPYRRAGSLAFDKTVKKPAVGTHQPTWAMATNLHDIPTYLTWDSGDSIGYLPAQSETFDVLLAGMGTPALVRPVSGTVDPDTGVPATHSWAVLDEAELFAFLAPRVAQRLPATIEAQLDQDRDISVFEVEQAQSGAFSWMDAEVDAGARLVRLNGVVNASVVAVDLKAAGLGNDQSVRVIADSADPTGFTLRLIGGDTPPGYLVDTLTNQILPGVESDPVGNALLVDVPAGAHVDLTTAQHGWASRLWMTPDPSTPGGAVSFGVDAPAGSRMAWTLIGTSQALTPIAGGVVLLVSPSPPALLLPVPLDVEGDVLVAATVPGNPSLAGASLLLQAVIQGADGRPSDATNVFRFDIE